MGTDEAVWLAVASASTGDWVYAGEGRTIPEALRDLADDLEAGEHEEPLTVTVRRPRKQAS